MRQVLPQHTGGAINAELPPAALEIIGNDKATREEVGNLIGWFRFWLKDRKQRPAKSTAANYLETLSKKSRELREEIHIVHGQKMPHELFAEDPELFALMRRLGDDLAKMTAKAESLKHKVQKTPTKTGEKAKRLERQLLSDIAAVYERQGMNKTQAAGKAKAIARAAEFSSFFYADVDPKKARELVKQAREEARPGDCTETVQTQEP